MADLQPKGMMGSPSNGGPLNGLLKEIEVKTEMSLEEYEASMNASMSAFEQARICHYPPKIVNGR